MENHAWPSKSAAKPNVAWCLTRDHRCCFILVPSSALVAHTRSLQHSRCRNWQEDRSMRSRATAS